MFYDILALLMAEQTDILKTFSPGAHYVPCDTSKYPSLYFFIDGRYYEIPPSSYIVNQKKSGLCILGIVPTNGKHFILGVVFLDSYYSILDDDNSQIAFVPNLETSG